MPFGGKIIWVTGASSGIGKALAIELASKGATLILSGRRSAELKQVAANCATNSFVLPFDVTHPDELTAAVDRAWNFAGRLDMLVNNAGISQRSLGVETTMAVYRQLMEVDFFAPVRLTQLVLPRMLQQGSGHIVAVASVAGKMGVPLRTGYCAAKHALVGYCDALRAELVGKSIDVSVVVPGFVRTSIAENALRGDGEVVTKTDPDIESGMDPAKAAAIIVDGLGKRKREINVGGRREMAALLLKRLWPEKLFDLVAAQAKESS